jgi:hypothetical protein
MNKRNLLVLAAYEIWQRVIEQPLDQNNIIVYLGRNSIEAEISCMIATKQASGNP